MNIKTQLCYYMFVADDVRNIHHWQIFPNLYRLKQKWWCSDSPTAIKIYYLRGFIMNVFITLNPHIENLSRKKLIKDFRFILQKYYRKTLGSRYYKHKDKQYKIGIFQEDGFSDFIQPHLHIIIDISSKYINSFYVFIRENLSRLYPSFTSDLQVIKNTKKDLEKVYSYCLKEGKPILTQNDLYERITDFN